MELKEPLYINRYHMGGLVIESQACSESVCDECGDSDWSSGPYQTVEELVLGYFYEIHFGLRIDEDESEDTLVDINEILKSLDVNYTATDKDIKNYNSSLKPE